LQIDHNIYKSANPKMEQTERQNREYDFYKEKLKKNTQRRTQDAW